MHIDKLIGAYPTLAVLLWATCLFSAGFQSARNGKWEGAAGWWIFAAVGMVVYLFSSWDTEHFVRSLLVVFGFCIVSSALLFIWIRGRFS